MTKSFCMVFNASRARVVCYNKLFIFQANFNLRCMFWHACFTLEIPYFVEQCCLPSILTESTVSWALLRIQLTLSFICFLLSASYLAMIHSSWCIQRIPMASSREYVVPKSMKDWTLACNCSEALISSTILPVCGPSLLSGSFRSSWSLLTLVSVSLIIMAIKIWRPCR